MPFVGEENMSRGQGRGFSAPFLFMALISGGCGNSPEVSSPKGCGETCDAEQGTASSAGTGGNGNCSSSDPALFQMAHWPMPGSTGEDPAAQYGVDGEITHDRITGLDWQRRVAPDALTDDAAVEYCAELDLGGHCDWRLPTRIEGVSLLDLSPPGDLEAFAESEWTLVLWSGNPERRFRLGSDGSFFVRSSTNSGPDSVRCVRGGGVPDNNDARYELTPDLATDAATGLTWTRAASKHTHADATAMCSSLQLDGGGFRVPSLKELHTLVFDAQAANPWIDPSAFPNFPKAVSGHIPFWTSSLQASHTDSAWMLDFATGTAEATGFTASLTLKSSLHVFCVRSQE